MEEKDTWTFRECFVKIAEVKEEYGGKFWFAIYASGAWFTMVFTQIYAPAHSDQEVSLNIMSALLWPVFWFVWSAFGFAYIIGG